MATYGEIITRAYGFSKKNQPNRIAEETSELVGQLNHGLRAFFAIAARVNPTFFGTSSAVAFVSPGWVRPATAEIVYWIETAAGAEVIIVPFDDRGAEPSMPGLFQLGMSYRPRGLGNDPTGDLTFFFSRQAVEDVSGLGATVDTGWPEAFNQLLSLELACYMARKDGRMEELGALMGERDRWLALFISRVELAPAGTMRRWNRRRLIPDHSAISVSSLLVGGSNMAVG